MDTAAVTGSPYRPRVIDAPLRDALLTAGAVVIEGARACGTTMTALDAAASAVFLDDPRVQQLLSIAPRAVLDGDAPRLVDEWQLAPELDDLVHRLVEAFTGAGRFILTGSSALAADLEPHAEAGRILRVRQRTMTWWEKRGGPAGAVSLAGLFDGETPATDLGAAPDLDDVVALVLQPGFPAMTALEAEPAAVLLRAYADEVARRDIHRIADVRHEPVVIARLIAAVARSVATEASYAALATEVRTVAPAILDSTVRGYVELLQRLFVVEAQPSWAPPLRSRARLRRSSRLHLADAALAAAVLGADADRLGREPAALAPLFESAAIHDLAVFATPLGGQVRHYRDSNGHGIDAVIVLPDGRWAAVDVELGGLRVESGAASLAAAVAQIDLEVAGDPVFRLVLTGTGPVLTLDDGTVSCPLTALTP